MLTFAFTTAIVATFLGSFLLLRTFFASKDELKATAALDTTDHGAEKSIIMRVARPFMNKYLVPAVEGVRLEAYRARVKRQLFSSGMNEKYNVDQFLALKILTTFGFPVGYVIMNWLGELACSIVRLYSNTQIQRRFSKWISFDA